MHHVENETDKIPRVILRVKYYPQVLIQENQTDKVLIDATRSVLGDG